MWGLGRFYMSIRIITSISFSINDFNYFNNENFNKTFLFFFSLYVTELTVIYIW